MVTIDTEFSPILGVRCHQMGSNAICWSPAEFRQQMTIYTDNICWLTREITQPNSDDIPTVGIEISNTTTFFFLFLIKMTLQVCWNFKMTNMEIKIMSKPYS
jgi:hypothetical protein